MEDPYLYPCLPIDSNQSVEARAEDNDLQTFGRGEAAEEDDVNRTPGRDEHRGEVAVAARTQRAVQVRTISDLRSLRLLIEECLDRGEETAGSREKMLSSEASNVSTLIKLFTADAIWEPPNTLPLNTDNDYMQRWYRQVAKRVQTGAEHLVHAVLYWQQTLAERENATTSVRTVHLMGGELHERGLGVARVDYLLDYGSVPFSRLRCMLKPEDRSIENALLGVDESIAEQLNRKLPRSKRVATLNMDAHAEHGTIVECVESSLAKAATTLLRKIGVLYDRKSITIETIALAFLGGIWDLHIANVMTSGGVPVLIDADVAVRPTEYKEGPTCQEAFDFDPSLIQEVRDQLKRGEGTSEILQYAMSEPDEVIKIIRSAIGNHIVRIVPVFTRDLCGGLKNYLVQMKNGRPEAATEVIEDLAQAISAGRSGSSGLEGELGKDRDNVWNLTKVKAQLVIDFEQGQIPCFHYQPSTGAVTYGDNLIWVGYNLNDSMRDLRVRLSALPLEPRTDVDEGGGGDAFERRDRDEGKETESWSDRKNSKGKEIEEEEVVVAEQQGSTGSQRRNPSGYSGNSDELEKFRRQWKDELRSEKKVSSNRESGGSTST